MKLFNSLQELWNYCSFCPLCRKDCRDVDVSVGPDRSHVLDSVEKLPDSLWMRCTFLNKGNKYIIERTFNCLDNSYNTEVTNVSAFDYFGTYDDCPHKNKLLNKLELKAEYFYFYIQSRCKECEHSSAHSLDLELDIVNEKVFDIGLDRESFYLLKGKEKFSITLMPDKMLVTRFYENKEGDLIESDKVIKLPLTKLDFLDEERVIDKIKTLILFS